ncbi:MAG: SIR2 family protein [Pyrinomonadaceae bacterium]
MDDRYQVFRSHNVYILGAGFSTDAGLPLICNFLDQMRDGVDWIAENGTAAEREAVNEVFKFRHWAAGAAQRVQVDLDNIEELFSLASASERDSGNDYVPRAIAATLRYAASQQEARTYRITVDGSKFQPPSTWRSEAGDASRAEPNAYRVSVYDLYAGLISGLFCTAVPGMRNTVISFNYDTLLEDSLTNLQIPFSYELPLNGADYHPSAVQIGAALLDRSAMRVLKLHGSVNWAINRLSQTESTLSVYSDYAGLIADGKHPYLLPPTWRKVFAGALGSVWTHALDAISEASRIIVIGSSMPKTDQYFKYLLAGGLRDNISLRDVIFVTLGDYTALQENVSQIFQPNLTGKIHWEPHGVQQAVANGEFRQRIDRALLPAFGNMIEPY